MEALRHIAWMSATANAPGGYFREFTRAVAVDELHGGDGLIASITVES